MWHFIFSMRPNRNDFDERIALTAVDKLERLVDGMEIPRHVVRCGAKYPDTEGNLFLAMTPLGTSMRTTPIWSR